MRLVVDASVAVKWVVDEAGHEAARALLKQDHELVAPDFLLLETANVLWKKVRLGQIDAKQAEISAEAISWPLSRIPSTAAFASRALELAIELDHTVYDCLYLATAEAVGGAVVTDDGRFLRLVEQSPYANKAVSMTKVAQ